MIPHSHGCTPPLPPHASRAPDPPATAREAAEDSNHPTLYSVRFSAKPLSTQRRPETAQTPAHPSLP
eukprot:CAMPEP_0206221658 /NCGR_PEP_ID=MMETSP0047_2-20121206/5536_1 /ASSEMBLY_ACC=CAM_ASM_000192 /TAXON_ID=195065 /ORGANISM="Chroomonas mesostigmatica_cf, Strain CCMP1168" /LENGTH=66 /DNA_ID=CAMNT_0053644415 /DNA_START=40 /DNA_END=237 /DNA_ORIENTATION=-